MTDQQQADAFFTNLAIFKLNAAICYLIGFVAILLSIAFSRLELTTISIWCIFGTFLLDQYASHLIVVHQAKVARWVAARVKDIE